MSYQNLKRELLSDPRALNKLVDLIDYSSDSINDAYKHLNSVQDIVHGCYNQYVVSNTLATQSTEATYLKKWMQKRYWNFYDKLARKLLFCFDQQGLTKSFDIEENFEQLKYKYLELWMKEWKFLFGHILTEISDFKQIEKLSRLKMWKQEFFENEALMEWLITVVLEQYSDVWLLWIITLKSYVSVEHTNTNQLKHVLNFMVNLKVPYSDTGNAQKYKSTGKGRASNGTNGSIELTGKRFLSSPNIRQDFLNKEKYVESFVALWMVILGRPDLDHSIQKHILNRLHIDVIPHFGHHAHLLNEFIENAFKSGGEPALLSVQSLYILMTQHGLVVDNFYNKLYQLIHPSIFDYPDQVGQFLDFLEVALSSPLITENIMIAFCKRISRVTLASPSFAVIYWARLVSLLLYKYPYLKPLIHKEDSLFETIQKLGRYQLLKLHHEGRLRVYSSHLENVNREEKFNPQSYTDEVSRAIFTSLLDAKPQLPQEDLFVENEFNLEATNAIKSSLWEIETLKSHPYKQVARECKSVRTTLRNKKNEVRPSTKELKVDPSYDELFLQLLHAEGESPTPRVIQGQFDITCFREN